PVGSRLPSIEAASRELNASYVTTQRAYRLLVEEGILESSPGVTGTRVIAMTPRAPKTRHLVLGGVFRPLRTRNEAENFALDMFEGVCRTAASRRVALLIHRMGRDAEGTLGAVEKALAGLRMGRRRGLCWTRLCRTRRRGRWRRRGVRG
ncbi:MAG TPA: hypothetical protein P5137_17495, partial [Candidatus Brocadiia bacterium]|nr:hypothetical protein [Candidatus Brocadiia bacterium]